MPFRYKQNIAKLKYQEPLFLNPMKVPTLSHFLSAGLTTQGGSINNVVVGNPVTLTDLKTGLVLQPSPQFTHILDVNSNIYVVNDSNNGYANITLPANLFQDVVSLTFIMSIKTPVATGISKTFLTTYNPAGTETLEIAITNTEKIRFYINDGANHIDLIGTTETYSDNIWRVFCFQWDAVEKRVTIRTAKEKLSQVNALIGNPVFYSTTRKTPLGCYMTNVGLASSYCRSFLADMAFFSSILELDTINKINKFFSFRLNIPFIPFT